jgi:hypothetical protein
MSSPARPTQPRKRLLKRTARPRRRWPNGRFRPARRRRTRCLCGEFATHTLSLPIGSGSRDSQPAWFVMSLCERCYQVEMAARAADLEIEEEKRCD